MVTMDGTQGAELLQRVVMQLPGPAAALLLPLPQGLAESAEHGGTLGREHVRRHLGQVARHRRIDRRPTRARNDQQQVRSALRPAADGVAMQFVLAVFRCERFSGTARAGDDAAEIGWFSLEDMQDLAMTPGTQALVRRLWPPPVR